MKRILANLKTEITRCKEIATGLDAQDLKDRATSRRAEADRLQDIYTAITDYQVKWKAILSQY
jgi:hypothetical protein